MRASMRKKKSGKNDAPRELDAFDLEIAPESDDEPASDADESGAEDSYDGEQSTWDGEQSWDGEGSTWDSQYSDGSYDSDMTAESYDDSGSVDGRSSIMSFEMKPEKKVWERPPPNPDDPFYVWLFRFIEDPEPFDEWANRIKLPEETKQHLREQEHHAMHRREKNGKAEKEGEKYYSRALGCCKLSSKPRRAVIRALASRLFSTIALGCILASAACLGLEDPTEDPVKDVIINQWWRKLPGRPGCTFEAASNYDPEAEYDDGTCDIEIYCGTCADTKEVCRLYSFFYRQRCHSEWGTQYERSMIRRGCMNPESANYDESATKNLVGVCGVCSDPELTERSECEATGYGSWKFVLRWTDLGLLIFFSTEMLMKLLASGLWEEPHSYVLVGWNWLDIIVVIPAWIPDHLVGDDSSVRVFRLLRPLRTINRFAGLRRLTATLMAAIPQLSGLLAILVVYFALLSIIGVQLWAGRWKQTCMPQDDSWSADGSWSSLVSFMNAEVHPTGQLCDVDLCTHSNSTMSAPCTQAGCMGSDVCLQGDTNPYEFEDRRPDRKTNMTDIMSFDSVPDALPIVLHIFTLASWQSLMHITQATSGDYCIVYFIAAVILGAYFLVQLFVAILKENFDIADTVVADGMQAFLQIDIDGSGELDKSEVTRIFLNAGLYLKDEELDEVFDSMDDDGNGYIELGEFMDWLRSGSQIAAKLRKKMSVDEDLLDLVEGQQTHNSDIINDGDTDEMIASAMHKLKLLSTYNDRVDFSTLFDYYDVDGDESLSLREFRMALRRDAQIAPAHMSNEEIEELFNQIDTDRSGSVELKEFEEWMATEEETQPPIDQLLESAMKQHIVKESCILLDIKRQGTTQDFTQVQNAMQKKDSPEVVRDFLFGVGFRELYVNYQPKVEEFAPGGFRDGKTNRKGGPSVVTMSSTLIEPLVGHAACFQTEADLRSELQSSGMTREDTTPAALVADLVLAGEVVALGEFRSSIRGMVRRPLFDFVFILAILANIVVLMVDHYGISSSLEKTLTNISHLFTMVFLVELVLKALGSTHREFWHDGFNIFEVLIVLVGLIELYGDLTAIPEDELSLGRLDASKAFRLAKVCRAFRVLRVLRLVGAIKSMRTVVDVLAATLRDLSYVLMMLGMFLYMFTVLGMQLYGGKLIEPDGLPPRAHWDNFHLATFTTFQIMTLDGYDTILYDCIRLRGPWTTMYFVSWIFIGSFVLVNLLLVTILEAYSSTSEKFAAQEERQDNHKKLMTAWESKDFQLGISTDLERTAMNGGSKPDVWRPMDSQGTELVASFAMQRAWWRGVTAKPAFDNIFIFMVLINMVVITYDTPWLDPNSTNLWDRYARALTGWGSDVFTVIFCLETVIKTFAGGFYKPVEPVAAPKAAYIGVDNPNMYWNRLDLFINIVGIMDGIAQVLALRGGDGRFFQSARSLRTLRLISRVSGLKILVKSIVRSIVSLYAVIGVMLLIWLVFGLTCVTFLKGRLYRCTDEDPAVEGMLSCVGTHVAEFPDGTVGLMDRSWHNPPVHFDDIFSAMYTLFEMSSMNDWVVKTRSAMDHTYLFKQPERDANKYWAYFLMFFIIVNNFFLVNLFIGVIYTKYLEAKFQGMEKLTKYQKEWLDIMISIDHVRPVKTHVARNPEREAAFKIADSHVFEAAMMGVIVLNVVVLALKYDGEPAIWTTVQDVLNLGFTLIFTGEMLVKLYAFGVKGYWAALWNRFDFAVVLTSWLDIFVRNHEWGDGTDPTAFRLIRIARVVGRISRVFKASRVLPESAILVDTFVTSLGGMFYVTMLITLILFCFGVVAMNLFGRIALQGCMNEYKNFQSVRTGMLTLFGVATGDGFSCMVHSVMVSETGKSFAIKGACSEELGTCGDSHNARAFFIFFELIITFTTIEMFVNVVLDRYEQLTRLREMKITGEDLEAFVAAWQKIDNEATGTIPLAEIQQVIDELNVTARGLAYEPMAGEEPISLHELRLPERDDGRLSRFIVTANPAETREDPSYTFVDPEHGYSSSAGFVNFHELLYGLCERKAGTPLPKDTMVVMEVRSNLASRMPTVAHIVSKKSRQAKRVGMLANGNAGNGANTKLGSLKADKRAAQQNRSMEWANPVGTASIDDDQPTSPAASDVSKPPAAVPAPAPAPAPAPEPAEETYTTEDGWYYKDPQGQLQGPHGYAEMKGWAAYFSQATEVQAPGTDSFAPLSTFPQLGGRPAAAPAAAAPAPARNGNAVTTFDVEGDGATEVDTGATFDVEETGPRKQQANSKKNGGKKGFGRNKGDKGKGKGKSGSAAELDFDHFDFDSSEIPSPVTTSNGKGKQSKKEKKKEKKQSKKDKKRGAEKEFAPE